MVGDGFLMKDEIKEILDIDKNIVDLESKGE